MTQIDSLGGRSPPDEPEACPDCNGMGRRPCGACNGGGIDSSGGDCHSCGDGLAPELCTTCGGGGCKMTEEVGAAVQCSVCGRIKAPRGRSVPAAMAGSRCDNDCSGYRLDPFPGELWPRETRKEFGYPRDAGSGSKRC